MTPAVRRLVREHKLNLADIQPSGKVRSPLTVPSAHMALQNTRITKEDIQNFLDGKQTRPSKPLATASSLLEPLAIDEPTIRASIAPASTSAPTAASAVRVEDRVEQIKGIKKAMVKSMTAALKVRMPALHTYKLGLMYQ